MGDELCSLKIVPFSAPSITKKQDLIKRFLKNLIAKAENTQNAKE